MSASRRTEVAVFAWTLFGASLVTYTAARLSGADTLRLVLKPLPVLALTLIIPRTRLGRTVIIGLILGALGDVLLEPRISALFLPGLASFLLGHIAYVAGFTRETRALAPTRILPAILIVATVLSLVLPRLTEPPLPIILYSLVIGALAWRSAARVGHIPEREAWLGVVGAFLFITSDTLLAVNRFVAPFDFAIPCILVTYWAAQALIALSVPREP